MTYNDDRFNNTPPLFLSEEGFYMLKALHEMDQQDSDLSMSVEKVRYDHHRDKGHPDWYPAWSGQKHPLGKHPDAQGIGKDIKRYWGFRELHRAGLLDEQGYWAYRITDMGRASYERFKEMIVYESANDA